MSTPFPSVAIVGLGLMGGSLALALKQQHAAPHIIGIARTRATLDAALAQGAIDAAGSDLAAVADAELIVLAAPVRTILRQIPQLAAHARAGALVLDMGSTKRAIVNKLNELPATLWAVGGHPMCGKEVAGFEAADADLYRNKLFVLCPTARTASAALETARALAETIGARVIELDAERHDQIAAAISHLPYAVASNLAGTVAAFAGDEPLAWEMASSGFRDTSRLAASDAQMMMDILLTNGENLAHLMRSYSRRFAELADAIYDHDEPALRAMLEQSARARRDWNGK